MGLILMVLSFVGLWKAFEKANEPGWKVFIPFYNTYIICKIGNCIKFFWIYLITSILAFAAFPILFVMCILSYESYSEANLIFLILFIVLVFAIVITLFVLQILIEINFAKAFGQSPWFGVGIAFFPYIFYMIIGFSNEIVYTGNYKEMNIENTFKL